MNRNINKNISKINLLLLLLFLLISSCSNNNIKLQNNNNSIDYNKDFESEINSSFESDQIKDSFELAGIKYIVKSDGKLYKLKNGKLDYILDYYDPNFYEINYIEENENKYLKSNGNKYLTYKYFEDSFENINHISDLINIERKWTTMTLLSPSAKNPNSYNKLRNCILKKTCSYLDNIVDTTNNHFYSGKSSLKTYVIDPSFNMITSKASLSTELIHFQKNDNLWYSAWYYIEGENYPFTIVDIESTWVYGESGIRLSIDADGAIYLELKYGSNPILEQKIPKVIFPKNKWVNIKWHFKLDNENALVEVWQNDQKIIEGKMKTLPLDDTLYNSLEIGITASDDKTIVYIDDIIISDKEILI